MSFHSFRQKVDSRSLKFPWVTFVQKLLFLGSVHKYFGGGGGLGKMEGGGQKSFELPEGGDQKVFLGKGGGVKKVWSNWKYNENQNAQFVAKINRI